MHLKVETLNDKLGAFGFQLKKQNVFIASYVFVKDNSDEDRKSFQNVHALQAARLWFVLSRLEEIAETLFVNYKVFMLEVSM